MSGRNEQTAADKRTEVAIVGGGLAGGLIALALRQRHPDIAVMLIEADASLGGNHRWSWFASDVKGPAAALLEPFRTTTWHGYDVRFPAYRRHLQSTYHSLSSTDFDAALRRELGQDCIHTGQRVAALDSAGVTLENGERISARAVIDCRGAVPSRHLHGGWQVFMGRHLRTAAPHGIGHPTIMDADLDQHGAYRFVYMLPLGASDLFIEDTYYADAPTLDRSALSARIDAYAAAQGLAKDGDFTIIGHETGVLPVITGGNFSAYQAQCRIDGVAMAGGRGGFVHPLTSYTLPFAAETALAIARDAELPGPQLAALVEARARRHWRKTGFYRLLGAMLFGAAVPEERYRIFERFYRLPETLIERFYAAHSTFSDKARVLIGKPPVAVSRAIRALIAPGRPLIAPPQEIT